MSLQYDQYLEEHIKNVKNAYNFMKKVMPERFEFEKTVGNDWKIDDHDKSKYGNFEYTAYDNWFYGNKSYENKVEFNKAWLHHIHNNPHHWQYWLLVEDDPEDQSMGLPFVLIEIPDHYIMEMIADWWSFSWKSGDLFEVFEWYKNHEKTIIMNVKSRVKVEEILGELKSKLGKITKKCIENGQILSEI